VQSASTNGIFAIYFIEDKNNRKIPVGTSADIDEEGIPRYRSETPTDEQID
jgi:hypothetical protein